jgi:hypothetical protein
MNPLDPKTAETLTAALASGRDALVAALNPLLLALPGVRTVTYLTIDLGRKETRRIGTSQGEGFPAGFAEPIPDAWFQGICVERRALIGDNPEQMATFLPETPKLVAAGYGSTLCIPIVIGGISRGTVNLLGDAGIFTPSLLARLDALLPLVALLFTFGGAGAS